MTSPAAPDSTTVRERSHQPVLVVVGPTAAGKTALAEELALSRDGEVISADSMQIYRGMDIGTAKPPPSGRRVPYHCLDLVDPGYPFSAALYQHHARQAIAACAARAKLPVLAGGTGLYIRAAIDAFEFPSGDQADNPVREHYEAQAAVQGPESVYRMLRELDPASAALIHPNNTRRVVRALEMHAQGVSYAEKHGGLSVHESIYDVRILGLTMEREALYRRIDERVDAMMRVGLLGEVERLLSVGLRQALTAAQAIGYKELVDVIEGGASLEDAVESIKRSTRRYAKRQLTWFRADPRVIWVDVTDLSPEGVAAAASGALDWWE